MAATRYSRSFAKYRRRNSRFLPFESKVVRHFVGALLRDGPADLVGLALFRMALAHHPERFRAAAILIFGVEPAAGVPP
jgi:hypothetical protein